MRYAGLADAFKNTVFITAIGTAINLTPTSAGAYVLTEKEMPWRNFMMWMVLITMFFGGGLIPLYLVVNGSKLSSAVGASLGWRYRSCPGLMDSKSRTSGAGV